MKGGEGRGRGGEVKGGEGGRKLSHETEKRGVRGSKRKKKGGRNGGKERGREGKGDYKGENKEENEKEVNTTSSL